MITRQYARVVVEWIASIGLDPRLLRDAVVETDEGEPARHRGEGRDATGFCRRPVRTSGDWKAVVDATGTGSTDPIPEPTCYFAAHRRATARLVNAASEILPAREVRGQTSRRGAIATARSASVPTSTAPATCYARNTVLTPGSRNRSRDCNPRAWKDFPRSSRV